MSPRTGGTTPVTIPGRYPEWTDPPLPTVPVPTTPGGDRTIQSGAGLRTSALVGPGHRIPILYGRCLLTPDIVQVWQSGNYAEFKVVISEGPIDAVEDWLTASDTFAALTVTLGSMSTPGGSLSGTVGLAAAYMRTKAGRPYQPRCIARGRTPYDPRLGAWGAGEYPDPTKCAYSTNPALAMADLLCFPQYGYGFPTVTPALVNWTSVEDAADWCDELVSGAKRYEINLYIQEAADASKWLDTIGLHAGLRWREEGGLWHLDYSAPIATVADAITDDHVVEGTSPRYVSGSGAGLADRPNRFRAEWIDPASGWITRTVEVRHPEVDAGAAVRDASVYKLHGFQSEAMALRALWRIAHEIWSEREFEAELTAERIDLVEGTRVPVTLSCLGLSAVDFIVTRATYETDSVTIAARRYDADTWNPPGATGGVLAGDSVFDTPAALANVDFTFEPYTADVVGVLGLVAQETRYRLAVEYDLPTAQWVKDVRVRLGTGTPTATTGGIVRFVPPLTPVADYALPITDGDAVEMSAIAGGSGFAGTVVVAGGYITEIIITTPGTGYTDNLGSLQSAVNGQLLSCLFVTEKTVSWVEAFADIVSWKLPALGNRTAPAGRGRIVIEDIPAPDIGNATPYGITVAAENVIGLVGPEAADGYSASYASLPGGGWASVGALTVEESDGAPSVGGVSKIKFSGATVTDDGSGVVTVTPSGGGAPVMATDAFTATAAQTNFALAHTPLADGIVYVTRDGVVANAADWSLSTSTIIFGTGLDVGTDVQVAYWRTAPTGASPAMEGFVAVYAQTDFPLAHVAGVVLVVAVNGVVQATTAWSIVGGDVLTLVSALLANDNVWISYLY